MNQNKFKIEIVELFWLDGVLSERDLCAHGHLKVTIGDEIVVDKDEKGGWTVSSTALLLLRTLERNHTKENPVGDDLIPCCGFNFIYEEGMNEVYLMNCPNGHDWEVLHQEELIRLTTQKGTTVQIPFNEYKKEVLSFFDSIDNFYQESKPKELPEDEYDRIGYLQFRKEWTELRNKWN